MMQIEALVATVVGLVSAGAALAAVFVRLSVESALHKFKAELLEALDARYVTRREYDEHLRRKL